MTKVIDKYWYVIYYRDFIKPKIYPVFFTSRKSALRAIRVNIANKKRIFYDAIQGKKLKEFQFRYLLSLGALGKFTKYEYPKELDTKQKRKNLRTVMRRRLRRMGMLTPVRQKYNIRTHSHSPYIKVIQNRQKVANSPNTIARVFRLERKPIGLYYIILDKKLSKKKGILFEVEAVEVNTRTKKLVKRLVRIKRTDIITPYLLTELFVRYGEKENIVDTCRKEGLRLNLLG